MILKNLWDLLKTAAISWYEHNAPRLGAALSYYTVFAISPLILIAIFFASLWFNQESVRAELFEQLSDLVGSRGAKTIEAALAGYAPADQGFVASVVAVGTLLLFSTGLFIELQTSLNTVFGVEAKDDLGVWGFIKNRLLSFAMVMGIGFLLLVTLIISAVLAALSKYISALVPGLDVIWMIVNGAVSLLVITVLFAMIYKVLPDVRIAWRDVWIGGLVTAVLFTFGKFLLGMYLGNNSTVSAYGAAGSVVLILLWVYWSAQIMFFGAEITRVYAERFGKRLRPKSHARWIASNRPMIHPAHQQPAGPSRKDKLLADLRKQVDTLRATARDKGVRPSRRTQQKTMERTTEGLMTRKERNK